MEALLNKRCSVRKYTDAPVEEEKLMKILEAGRLSPSARNRQAWKFVVVRDPQVRKGLRAVNNMPYCEEAPVFIAIVGTQPENVMPSGVNTDTVDGTIATASMMWQATELGLGTCWIGAFDQQKVKDLLQVPASALIVNILLVGYARKENTGTPRRSPLESMVSYDKF